MANDGITLYVSPEGSDNSGDGSFKNPYKTIAFAKEIVRSIILNTDKDITIVLRGGKYSLNKTLVFEKADSGNNNIKITYKNYKNEKPVITSNIKINGFTLYQNGIYKAQLPKNENGQYPEFRDLYVNGKRAVLARTGKVDDYMFFPKTYDLTGMYVNPGILENIPKGKLEPMELCFNVEWMSRRFRISSYSIQEDGTIHVITKPYEWQVFAPDKTGYPYYPQRSILNSPYWFENHLSLLDEPGEWYYDKDTGIVYYYPLQDEDINNIVVEYPVLEILLKFNGKPDSPVTNITFEGISFTGVTNNYANTHGYITSLYDIPLIPVVEGNNPPQGYLYFTYRNTAAIYGMFTNNITIKGCKLYEVGTSGIFFKEGCNNICIEGNAITNIAMSGIQVADTFIRAKEYKWCSNINICNNYIENVGTDYKGSVGIFVTRVCNLKINHNHLKHLPYSGIAVGYGWVKDAKHIPIDNNQIIGNCVEDAMYALNDGGSIYTTGYVHSSFTGRNVISGNYLKSNASSVKGSYGIYHDGTACDWFDENNVFDGYYTYPIFCQCFIEVQLAKYIKVINNYSTVTPIKENYSNSSDKGLVFANNLFYNTYAELPKEAMNVIKNSGLLQKYKKIVPLKEVQADVYISSPHQMLLESATLKIEFTISNNTNSSKIYTMYPYYIDSIITNEGISKKQICGLPDFIKLRLYENIELPYIYIDKYTGFPQIVVKPMQEKIKFGITLEINKVISSQKPLILDFKLIPCCGKILSFPRTVSIFSSSQWIFMESPCINFNIDKNLLKNGDMNTDEAWIVSVHPENGNASYEETEGNRSLRVMINKFSEKRSSIFMYQKNIAIKSNKKYRISFYMKISSEYGHEVVSFNDMKGLLFRFYQNDGKTDICRDGNFVDFSIPDLMLKNEQWVKIQGLISTENFILPEGSLYMLKLYIGGGEKNLEMPINLYFDNFSLIEIE